LAVAVTVTEAETAVVTVAEIAVAVAVGVAVVDAIAVDAPRAALVGAICLRQNMPRLKVVVSPAAMTIAAVSPALTTIAVRKLRASQRLL